MTSHDGLLENPNVPADTNAGIFIEKTGWDKPFGLFGIHPRKRRTAVCAECISPLTKFEFLDVLVAGDPCDIVRTGPEHSIRTSTRYFPTLRAMTFSNGAYATLYFEHALTAEAPTVHRRISFGI
jgi:hypothetical protein